VRLHSIDIVTGESIASRPFLNLADANDLYHFGAMDSRLRFPLLAIALAAVAATARGQTVTWGGGFPDQEFTTASNWVGGVAPLNNGSETLVLNGNSSSTLDLDENAFFSEVIVQPTGGNPASVAITGTQALTIGPGGIYVQGVDETASQLTVDVPIVLTANQTWGIGESTGSTLVDNGSIAGSFGLTLNGDDDIVTFTLSSANSYFSGGVYLTGEGSLLSIGASSIGPAGAPTFGPVGTGMLTLGDGTFLTTTSTSLFTIGNAMTLGDGSGDSTVQIGGLPFQNFNTQTNLTLTGPVTLNDADLEVDIGSNSWVTFAGNLTGYTSSVCLDFGSAGYGNAVADVQGNISNVARLDLENGVTVILDAPSIDLTSGTTQIIGVTDDIGVETNAAYLGLGKAYAASGYVTAFLSYLNTTGSSGHFYGTFGFDTTTGATATFNDPVDLTSFPQGAFTGLGSATSAILSPSAVITPPGGLTSLNPATYPFGGGGGTLTVQSPLVDGTNAPSSVSLSAGNAPLTLVLSGSMNYSGGTTVVGGALIYNALPPGGDNFTIGDGASEPGYIGSTVNSGYSDGNGNIEDFILLFTGGVQGVIGFDILGGGTRTVSSNIDVSDLSSGIFLGTATSVDFTSTITPQGSTYRFAGVKGGQVEVSSPLAGPSNSLVAGLQYTLESYNPTAGFMSVSSVTLSGDNTYGGGTTLNSGTLYVTNANSIGTGPLAVPDPQDSTRSGWAATLSSSQSPVVLSNNISVPDAGLSLNSNSAWLLTLTGNITPNEGDSGQIGIFGPVTLSGSNTYSGGTTIAPGADVTIGSDTGFGTGSVNATNSTLNFTSGNPILGSAEGAQVNFTEALATFAGSPTIVNLSLAEGTTLNFNGPAATIIGFNGDSPNSDDVMHLGSGTTLTIDTNNPNDGSDSGTYYGTITGLAGSNLVVTGGGSLDLRGANTYPGGTTDTGVALIVSNNGALGTGPVTVNGGILVTNTGVTVTNAIILNGSPEIEAGLAGFGTFSPGGSLAFQNFSGVDPGRAMIGINNGNTSIPIPGALTFGGGTNISFGTNGAYLFAVTDANGPAGTGYGTVNMAGSLTIAGGPFFIDLFTYDPATNLAGNALNFNPAIPYTWTLVSAGSIAGFNAGSFDINASNFLNSTNGGLFSVGQSGNDLTLNFTPVPEPSTWAMMGSGLFALAGAAVRRRRR
jgi:autotransporter-associated beta strand protein